MNKERIFQILLLTILLSSCEKDQNITQEDFLGKWLYTYSFYTCGNVGNPENYLEECSKIFSSQLNYEFLKKGVLIETSITNEKADTFEWVYNEVSNTLLLYREGVLGIEIDNILTLDRVKNDELVRINIVTNTTTTNVYEHKFKRYE